MHLQLAAPIAQPPPETRRSPTVSGPFRGNGREPIQFSVIVSPLVGVLLHEIMEDCQCSHQSCLSLLFLFAFVPHGIVPDRSSRKLAID